MAISGIKRIMSPRTTGAIYRRYPDKETLFDALVKETKEGFLLMFTSDQDVFLT